MLIFLFEVTRLTFENMGSSYYNRIKHINCTPKRKDLKTMRIEDDLSPKDIVVKFFEEGYTNHNYDFVMNCVAENYIDNSPAAARSNADAVGILKIVAGQFSNLTIKVLDVFAEGGMVATRILYDGIHTGTYMGIPATGKHITFEALENFKVENGKITESWGYWPDKEIEQKLKSE